MNRYLLTLMIAFFMLVPMQQVAAQSHETQLIQELNRLIERLLQLQRYNIAAVPAYRDRSLTPSKYYDGPYEAIYLIENGALHPYGNTIFKARDQRFWDLWRTVVGNITASYYFTEVRLYRDSDAKYDAFVERLTEDDWILGVNLAGLDITDPLDRASTIELFVHEYAHVLHYYYPEVAADFAERFWSTRSGDERDYVSAYAMQSAEEDFSESFMYYVLGLRPEGGSGARKKVRFFSQYDAFERVRADILERVR